MPIPHLQHKIHSPNSWKDGKPKKVKHKTSLPKAKKKASFFKFFNLKKSKATVSIQDISLKNKKPGRTWRGLIKRWWPYILVLILIIIIAGFAMLAWLAKDLPDPGKLTERKIAQSTKIYDRTGEHLLYEIHGEQKRTLIPLAEIPDYAIQATLALEDQRFYEHKGFSLWGMFRGVVLRTLKGQSAQGGSTLTQQLIKNAILTNERSIIRKAKELILAYKIEKDYSKEEILQMYFNEIPYGSTAYGIEAASYHYFGKSAKELTLGEAAILAALPQSPTYLSPYGSHADRLFARQAYCLDQMTKLGYVTKEQAEAAKAEDITFKQRIEGIEAPHFVFFVKEQLSEKYGDLLVEQGGLKIISTLDYDLQKKAEEIIKEEAEKNQENFDASNASLVAIDVATGQILAMVGSKDFFDDKIDGQVNVATSPRQPGSSFKPIVYTAGFIKGYVPETVVYDLETTFKTFDGNYVPHNYDLKEHGPVSLRTALAGSLNIPAVKMIYLTGIDGVLNLAADLGYSTLTDRSRFGLSLVLGGGEVKLLEHVNAFAALAREGRAAQYSYLLSLEDGEGKVMEEFQKPGLRKVMETETARMTNDVLSDNNARAYIFGQQNYLTLPDRPVAAKTGTTNDYHDAWTIGYTPQIATGVWVGNSNNDAMKRGADGSVVAAPIWQRFMKEATAELSVQNFTKPTYQIPSKPMLGGGANGVKVKIDKMSGLLATDNTPEHLIEEKTFQQAHTILHYVNKDDPLGPAPADPSSDEYYAAWEEAVAKWATENNIINEDPPIEKDNIHLAEDKPTIRIISLEEGQAITDNRIDLEVRISANREVDRVEYYLDNKLLSTSYSRPFNEQINIPPTILNGSHSITAKIYDDLENTNQDTVGINLSRQAYLNINWLEPTAGENIQADNFPLSLLINIDEVEKVKKVDFYYKTDSQENGHWINYVNNPLDNNLKTLWSEAPSSGVYKLYLIITDQNNQIIQGPTITINLQ